MYQPTDLKKGTLVQIDDKPFRVVDYAQKVMGRGGSIVNVRLKSIVDGSVIAKTYKGADKIEPATVEHHSAQFLYADGNDFHFMDPESFEQFQLSADLIDEAKHFLKEGQEVDLQFFNNQVINVELPKNLYLKVTYTENVVRGDTTGSLQKSATVETGYALKVPAFIKIGDEIKIDTRTGEYLERRK